MQTNQVKLIKARIYDSNKNSKFVECMFNPYEYTLSKSNSFTEIPRGDSNTSHGDYSQANPQTLSLSLIFDAYEKGGNVLKDTRQLMEFMRPKTPAKKPKKQQSRPPVVVFSWGDWEFKGVISNMTQRFILFDKEGNPLRARVDITFTQFIDEKEFPRQGKRQGGTIFDSQRVVFAGDRLDAIAEEVLGDPDQWQRIAEYNHIHNPLHLKPGQKLRIPLD